MNTTEKIVLRKNKTLKLNNVLIREISKNELVDINQITYMMDSYIKTKGNSIVGPLINYYAAEGDENGQINLRYKMMMQLKNPINNIDKPYEFSTQIRVPNCLFAKFTEKEENIQFVYSKLQLYAFEEDIKLKGDSYTVFLDKKDDGNIIADVFMEIQKGGNKLESL